MYLGNTSIEVDLGTVIYVAAERQYARRYGWGQLFHCRYQSYQFRQNINRRSVFLQFMRLFVYFTLTLHKLVFSMPWAAALLQGRAPLALARATTYI